MATTLSSTPASGCQAAGRKLTSQCWSSTKIWSRVSIMGCLGSSAPLPAPASGRRSLGCGGSGRGLGLGVGLGLLRRQPRIHRGRFGGMNPVVILVRSCQLLAVEQQPAKAVRRAQLKLGVHLDGFKGADLDADLAAHADRNIDVEARRIKLRLAQRIRLLVFGLLDVECTSAGTPSRRSGRPRSAARPPNPRRRKPGRERRAPPRCGAIRCSGYSTVVSRSAER